MKKTLLGYLAEDSPVHALHPFTKLMFLLIASSYPMFIDMIEVNIVGTVIMLILLSISRVELMILKRYKTILLNLFAIIAIAYTFFGGYAPGYRVLAELGPIKIAWENLRWAITVYSKLVFAVLIIIFFLSTSRERDIIIAFRTIRLPYTVSYVAGLAFRSIGLSLIDFFTIREAEKARALNIDELPFSQKVKKFGLYIIPMTALVLRRAEEVANALDSRGFTMRKKEKRTDYIKTKYTFRSIDLVVNIVLIALLTTVLTLRYALGLLTTQHSLLYSF